MHFQRRGRCGFGMPAGRLGPGRGTSERGCRGVVGRSWGWFDGEKTCWRVGFSGGWGCLYGCPGGGQGGVVHPARVLQGQAFGLPELGWECGLRSSRGGTRRVICAGTVGFSWGTAVAFGSVAARAARFKGVDPGAGRRVSRAPRGGAAGRFGAPVVAGSGVSPLGLGADGASLPPIDEAGISPRRQGGSWERGAGPAQLQPISAAAGTRSWSNGATAIMGIPAGAGLAAASWGPGGYGREISGGAGSLVCPPRLVRTYPVHLRGCGPKMAAHGSEVLVCLRFIRLEVRVSRTWLAGIGSVARRCRAAGRIRRISSCPGSCGMRSPIDCGRLGSMLTLGCGREIGGWCRRGRRSAYRLVRSRPW